MSWKTSHLVASSFPIQDYLWSHRGVARRHDDPGQIWREKFRCHQLSVKSIIVILFPDWAMDVRERFIS
ncbi:hypothetical protein CEXT_55021 [Caerostris extrusa]|uniref:Ycf15 n=1 Tax=Caerostris extrusa TaxID=172846 RepID=A0AAV4RH07_CAEEX|nr:hypothetical protein CEXT_55021 [Caerostris extrusa]